MACASTIKLKATDDHVFFFFMYLTLASRRDTQGQGNPGIVNQSGMVRGTPQTVHTFKCR